MANGLVIRADAGPILGAGHVMRCLALSQAWQDSGGAVSLITATESPSLIERLKSEGIEVVTLTQEPGTEADAAETVDLARRSAADWVVVDGYHFDAEFQRRIKENDLRLLFLDDFGHADHYSADIVLNQNAGDCAGLYSNRQAHTQLLLGSRYLLLRRKFREAQVRQRETPAVARNILVTLGGGDHRIAIQEVIEALAAASVEDLQVKIIAGRSGQPSLGQLAGANVQVMDQVDNLAELMLWADLAITVGGGTCWEAAFLGLPCLAIVLAGNQQVVVDALSKSGALRSLGQANSLNKQALTQGITALALDIEGRREMSLNGPRVIDGQGANRVVARLQSRPISLRPATQDDRRMIFDWANASATRAASFCSDPILWETHVAWYDGRLNDANCLYFIAIDHRQTAVGQVRFEIKGEEAAISVGLDDSLRGRGYGVQCLELATDALFRSTKVARINAFIKPENIASLAAFTRAGYVFDSEALVRNLKALHFVLRRGEAHSWAPGLGESCRVGGQSS